MAPKAPPAPKGKPPAGKPPAKAPEPAKKDAGEKKASFFTKMKNPKFAWPIIAVALVALSLVLILMIQLYASVDVDKASPYDEQIQKLKSTMAIGLKTPKLTYENPLKVADEVVILPEHITKAEKSFETRKAHYHTLFTKGVKSAGAWQQFGKSLYYISKGEKSWYDAENFCMSRDAHLASILSDEEQDYIASQLKEPAWIGLTDENEEGNWEWTDGSRLEAEYWSDGKPSRAVQYGAIENDCTYIVPSPIGPTWMDTSCYDHKRWVCKESLDEREP